MPTDLVGARSRQCTLFRAVLYRLHAGGVRDLRTGGPIEVALALRDVPVLRTIEVA
jgi:hypothetical protein